MENMSEFDTRLRMISDALGKTREGLAEQIVAEIRGGAPEALYKALCDLDDQLRDIEWVVRYGVSYREFMRRNQSSSSPAQ